MLKEKEINIHISYIGEYFTSMEMGGYSITLTRLDGEPKRLLNAPAHSPLFIQN